MNIPPERRRDNAASIPQQAIPRAAAAATPPPVRARAHREREFGVGYGNSSGYGVDRHFLPRRDDPLFLCR